MKPLISVVMGAYNNREVLKRVLDGFNEQTTRYDFEVIVVDSSSTDGTDKFLNEYPARFSLIPIIQENQGKAAARNRGVSEAAADYVIITDADMIPDSGFIQAHCDAHLNSLEPSCFEGLAWNMAHLHWPPRQAELKAQVGTNPPHMARLGWYYFLTGNISFPKSLFDSEQGFSESFKNYGWEDLELGYRLLEKRKIPLLYLKTAINYHYHVISKEEEVDRCFLKGESADILIQKHPELKLFLGINPLSKWVYPKIDKSGRFYTKMRHDWLISGYALQEAFAFWFLKEYEYLSGLFKANPDLLT